MRKIYKKKNGFTLVELIVSITLLALIGISVGVYLNRISGKTEENEHKTFVNKVKSSASVYLAANNTVMSELQSNKAYVVMTINDLKDSGLLAANAKDPLEEKNDLIAVSLDENGSLVIEYPYEAKGEYINAKDIKVVLNDDNKIDPYAGINTLSFGHIDAKGFLVNDLVSGNNIICKTDVSTIDTKKMGTYKLKYEYINNKKVKTEVTRNVLVVDSTPPVLSDITLSDTNWVKGSVTYSATAMDAESGLKKYCAGKVESGFCTPNQKQKKLAGEGFVISKATAENGIFSIAVIDMYDNKTEKSIIITNVDNTVPAVNSFNLDTAGYAESAKISGTIEDKDSGLAAYQINNSSTTPSSGWIAISGSPKNYTVNKTVDYNGTYYLWAKDAVGNISLAKSLSVQNIYVIRSKNFSNSGLSGSSSSGSYTVSNIIEIDYSKTSASLGSISSINVTSSGFNYYVNNSRYSSTCSYTEPPNTADLVCTESHACLYGGSYNYSSGRCDDEPYDITSQSVGHYFCGWSSVDGPFSDPAEWPSNPCRSGYHSSTPVMIVNSTPAQGDSCAINSTSCCTKSTCTGTKLTLLNNYGQPADKASYCDFYNTWQRTCNFNDYGPSCSSSDCPYGYTERGGSCYDCDRGTLNSSNYCVGSESCNKYQYDITVYYKVKK